MFPHPWVLLVTGVGWTPLFMFPTHFDSVDRGRVRGEHTSSRGHRGGLRCPSHPKHTSQRSSSLTRVVLAWHSCEFTLPALLPSLAALFTQFQLSTNPGHPQTASIHHQLFIGVAPTSTHPGDLVLCLLAPSHSAREAQAHCPARSSPDCTPLTLTALPVRHHLTTQDFGESKGWYTPLHAH